MSNDTPAQLPDADLAIIGGGPSGLFLLRWLEEKADRLCDVRSILVLEKGSEMGCGMPYSIEFCEPCHLANLTSGEIPPLPETLIDWLQRQDRATLEELGIEPAEMETDTIFPRIAVGAYFNEQFEILCGRLRERGLVVSARTGCPVVDLIEGSEGVEVVLEDEVKLRCGRVAVATGHTWRRDKDEGGYYASPWPIYKLLPENGEVFNFPVGLLGASLSAYDTALSLALRHGRFELDGERITFVLNSGAEGFRMVMHSVDGKLPELQFAMVTERAEGGILGEEDVAALADDERFLSLDRYFQQMVRPRLVKAFRADGMKDEANWLMENGRDFAAFVAHLESEHECRNAFEEMRADLGCDEEKLREDRPTRWKETFDDLIYALNFHAEKLSAEDYRFLKKDLLPYWMTVIAAMPLVSAKRLLALHDAGCLDLVAGKVAIEDVSDGVTVCVDAGDKETSERFRMFVDCTGQPGVEVENYPFPSLRREGRIREAAVRFKNPPRETDEEVMREGEEWVLRTGGIDVDPAFRLIGRDGVVSWRVFDVAFPHLTGVRPYLYGLQGCADAAESVVRSLVARGKTTESESRARQLATTAGQGFD